MTGDSLDPFDLPQIPRDRFGRPQLIPEGGTIRLPYTRSSSLAQYVSGDYGLTRWRMRHLAKGLSDRPDLAEMGSALPVLTNDRATDRPTNVALDVIIEDALVTGNAYAQANYGTAVHGHTEPVADHPRGPVPARMKSDVESFWEALDANGIKILATELFVACDEIMTAGTFDHIVYVPGVGYVVADKKTGDLHGIEFAIQLASYAHGRLYDTATDKRSTFPVEVRTDWALIIRVVAGKGRTELHWLDITKGWEQAKQAAKVRDWQGDDAMMLHRFEDFTPPALGSAPRRDYFAMISDATTLAELGAIAVQAQAETDFTSKEKSELQEWWNLRRQLLTRLSPA